MTKKQIEEVERADMEAGLAEAQATYEEALKRFKESSQVKDAMRELQERAAVAKERRWAFWKEFGQGLAIGAVILALGILAMFAL